jgi:hypothetical protein
MGNFLTCEWRKLHNEELNDLYSHSIVRVIKSRRKGWEGHVTRMEYRIRVYRISVGTPEAEKDNLKDPGVDGRITLR